MKIYENIEKNFNIIYPNNEKATYSSILNFSEDLTKPIQRWFKYKEGYSIELIQKIIDENKLKSGIILDPFSGSGTTLLGANYNKIKGIGFEVNPFSYFMSQVKLHNYTAYEIKEIESNIKIVLSLENNYIGELPKREMMKNVFTQNTEIKFMKVKYNIINLNVSDNTKRVFLLGWVSLIEIYSNYRKSGNGLKKRNVKVKHEEKNDFIKDLETLYLNILIDIKSNSIKFDSKIINDTCLNMDKYIKDETIDGIIFSPPYANCFDYTEIYKLELWFGDFVNNNNDLKNLRSKSLRSHLNSNLKQSDYIISNSLEIIMKELLEKKLWDKRIPTMIRLYFNDMFVLLNKLFNSLKKNGFCNIIVSNSAYGGIVIPTDLLIAEYAVSIGFQLEKIEVDRYIITSSQQYRKTLEYKKYLRESIICLRK